MTLGLPYGYQQIPQIYGLPVYLPSLSPTPPVTADSVELESGDGSIELESGDGQITPESG
jgi:hypothetical protein